MTTASRRLLITAGPTREPIDGVRYLGNRSSGSLGVAVANAASASGWSVRLLLGPVDSAVARAIDERVLVERFERARELGALLEQTSLTTLDALVMAAAVADYEVEPGVVGTDGKLRRGSLSQLELSPTPDLIQRFAERRGDEQSPRLIAFALEPRETLVERAQHKLRSKGVDVVIANPIETIDSQHIEALLVSPSSVEQLSRMTKDTFASWLVRRIDGLCNG